MQNLTTEIFDKGIYNSVTDESVPQPASIDALGWVSTDDTIETVRGRLLFGGEDGNVDISQNKKGDTTAVGQADAVSNKVKIAQSFKPTREIVNGISLWKLADTGNFTGTVTIEIQSDDLNKPDGVALATKTYTNEQWLLLTAGHFDFNFTTQISLDLTKTYWIVVYTSTTDSLNYINLAYKASNEYTNGRLMFNNTSNGWTDLGTSDLYFRTLTTPYGSSTGLHFGYKSDGSLVVLRKAGKSIQWWNGSYWLDVATGLETDEIYTFSNYTSLAGNFTYIGGKSALLKIVLANPTDAIDVYLEANNFKGKIRVDRGRMLLWDRAEDKTGLYGSKIDPQGGSVYNLESAELLGASGSTTYSGTLSFKAGNSRASCFGIVITTTINGETVTVTDNFSGLLRIGDTNIGTINYATGEYTMTFSAVTEANVNADYQWEDSTIDGLTDFRKSATRVAGEGFIFRQDEGGDKIMKVLIQDGKYYSIKEKSVYEVNIAPDDASATNLPYRLNIGIPSYGGAIETSIGIVFMNTANPDKPILTTLQRNTTGSELEPIILSPQFNFADYIWSEMAMETYGEYVVFSGKTKESDKNNRLFLFNNRLNIVDIARFNVNNLAKDAGVLYAGSSVNFSVSKILTGFDDDGSEPENYWISRGELFSTQALKKIKKFQVKGKISRLSQLEVYISEDDEPYRLIGTVLGNGSYVDFGNTFTIGSSGIGTSAIGGDYGVEAFPYHTEFKFTSQPKFRKRNIKFIKRGIGYTSVQKFTDYDVRFFDEKLPKKYRIKQNVSTSGLLTDQ